MFKNIVLSGGSSKGYSYVGVLKSLEENNLQNDIKHNILSYETYSYRIRRGLVDWCWQRMEHIPREIIDQIREEIVYTPGIINAGIMNMNDKPV